MIVFGANLKAIRDLAKLEKIEDNVIIGVKSGKKDIITDKNGMYVYPLTIKRKKKASENDMDIGFASKTRFEALAENEEEECHTCNEEPWDF